MPFITLGSAAQLQIKVPTKQTTDWADTMRTDTFLKIAEHAHTGSGDGSQLSTGSLAADAVTGAKLRLDNNQYIRGRNAAGTANVDLLKLDTNDELFIDAVISKLLLKNDTYITARNAADSASVDLLKLDANDDAYVDPDVAKLNLKNDTNLTARNNADSADVNLLKLNTSDQLAFPTLIASLGVINDTYITGRNNADSANINMFKVGADDEIKVGATITSATITTAQTNQINSGNSSTLTDNTSSATSASVIDLDANEAVVVHYKLIRGTAVASGTLYLEESNKSITREEVGDSVGVTFSLNACTGDLEYTTTSTGTNVTMTYQIIQQ